MGIHVDEQQLSWCQPRVHSFNGARATQAAQLPDHVRFGRDVEHHLGAAQSPHATPREGLVAEDLLGGRDDDGMVVHVDQPVAQARLEVVDATRALPLLHGARRVLRFADAPIDQALEPDLRVVVEMRAADVDVEERRDILTVRRLDLCAHVALQARHHLRDLSFGRRRDPILRDVEEDEIVVVREAHHHARVPEVIVIEELANRTGCRFQYRVQLLPPVDFLDLRVADEVEVEHDELAALLEELARPLDRDGQGGQPGEGVVQHLLLLHLVHPVSVLCAERRTTRDCGPRARGDFLRCRGQQIPLFGPQLDRTAAGLLIRAAHDHREPALVGLLHAVAKQRGVRRREQYGANAGLRERGEYVAGRTCLGAPPIEQGDRLADYGIVRIGEEDRLAHMPCGMAAERGGALRGDAHLIEVALHCLGEHRQVKGLLHVIVGAELQRLAFIIPRVEGRHHDDAHLVAEQRVLLHDAAHLPAVATRHHHVEQYERRLDGLVQRECLVAVVGDGDWISTDLQILPDDLRVVVIVIHHQDGWQPRLTSVHRLLSRVYSPRHSGMACAMKIKASQGPF